MYVPKSQQAVFSFGFVYQAIDYPKQSSTCRVVRADGCATSSYSYDMQQVWCGALCRVFKMGLHYIVFLYPPDTSCLCVAWWCVQNQDVLALLPPFEDLGCLRQRLHPVESRIVRRPTLWGTLLMNGKHDTRSFRRGQQRTGTKEQNILIIRV